MMLVVGNEFCSVPCHHIAVNILIHTMHESTELVSPYGMDEYITQDRRLDLIVIQFEFDHEVFNSLAIVSEWVEEHRCSLAEMVRFHPELDELVPRWVNHLCRLVVFHILIIPRSCATLHQVRNPPLALIGNLCQG